MVSGDVMLNLHSLSSTDICGIRHSWGLAKNAAAFEVHGPAFYRLYELMLENYTHTWLILVKLRMFETHPPWRQHFNHMGGHLPLDDHTEVPRYLKCQDIWWVLSINSISIRFVKHTATVFRFLDKCVADLDNPKQTIDNFRLVTKIHAIQGVGIKDFFIIKGR